MTMHPPLWQQNNTYPAVEDRTLLGVLRTPGVCAAGDLVVSARAAGANMSVDVAAGACVVGGTATAGQGRYLCRSDAVVNVALAASPTAGTSRIDAIVATVRDSAVAGTDDDWILQAVTGTAAVSPAAPTIPASSLLLAYVVTTGGAASPSTYQDRRVASLPAPWSAVPAYGSAGQSVTLTDGSTWVHDGSLWQPLGRKAVFSAATPSDVTSAWAVTSPYEWATATVSNPGWPCVVTAHGQGVMGAQSGQSNVVGWLRVDLSSDGGGSWSTGRQAQFIVPNELAPVPVSTMAGVKFSTPSGDVKARLVFQPRDSGRGVTAAFGRVQVTVTPA